MQRTLQRRLQHTGRERDAEAARDAILGAAKEIFARDGFSGARVDDIARQAGYNKALIFHYFDDKLGLYRALMLRTKQYLFAALRRPSTAVLPAMASVSLPSASACWPSSTWTRSSTSVPSILRRCASWPGKRPKAGRFLQACAPTMPESWSQRALTLIERAQAAGIVRAELDPRLLFTTLISLPLIHMVSLPRFATIFPDADFTSPAAIAHAREQITGLLLCGILSPTTTDFDVLTASHSGQTTLAHSAEEA